MENVRFSGGEPTLYDGLFELVKVAKACSVKHIAVSTNGSAAFEQYKRLIESGVNDFSISLDACCVSMGKTMAGGVDVWKHVVENIKRVSEMVYVTVGVVVNETNLHEVTDVIRFADSLGVSDIRIISAAQYNAVLGEVIDLEEELIDKYPILKYRINHFKGGRNVRGITRNDSRMCGLAVDDMVVAGDWHFPCIIYLREGGDPIGRVGIDMRRDRVEWAWNHDTHNDPICAKNCLDVCIDYNNKFEKHHRELDTDLRMV